MDKHLTKIALILLAVIAVVGIAVAGVSTARRMGLFTEAGVGYEPKDTPLVQTTSTTATIQWQTSKPVVCKINYGTSEDSLSLPAFESSGAVQTTDHLVNIQNLSSDRTYYYEIQAGEQTFKEPGYFFRTKPAVNAVPSYPTCDIEVFKSLYGYSQGDENYDSRYDINNDKTINSVDFFECLKANPSK